ncbi:hypothetical protein PTMSG1_03917 [Pyrenophora teres f. maculata]|nr:hypothetical protein PTMSG1_03917 [Pyrenophora teres f. maculata]
MESPSATIAPAIFSREEIQDIFDEAQLRAGDLYQDVPYLQRHLQDLFREALETCNLQGVNSTKVLQEAIISERIMFNAFNKHRLGNAITAFCKRVLDPKNEVEYKEEENIPEKLEFFPLLAAVVDRGAEVTLDPIFQLEGTVEGNQEGSSRAPVPSKKPGQAGVATGHKTSMKLPNSPKKTGSSASYNKLRGAPSAWLALPEGNLTLAEVMAFVPQSIKSVDVINRFLFNGAMTTTLTDMINNYRIMEYGAITNNSVYRMMKGQINHHAQTNPQYRDWSVAKHARLPRPQGFDPASVSVAGFATPVILSGREARQAANEPTPAILFRDLANDIKVMPSGYDALDLTRCVQYCVEHDEEDWYYPQQFDDLVEHLGGPAPVHRKHQDAASVTRHTEGKKLVNAKRAGGRARDNHGRLMKGKGKAVVDPDEGGEVESNDQVNSGSDQDVAGSSLRRSQRNKRKRGPNVPSVDEELRKPLRKKTKHTHVEDSSDEVDGKAGSSLHTSTRNKRKRNSESSDDEGAGAPSKWTSQRKKKPLPKPRVPRVKPAPPDLRGTSDVDSDSEDSDVYVGPKRQRRVAAVRTSGRAQRFGGSYNIDEALKIDDEEDL